jgi:hypothetical protein
MVVNDSTGQRRTVNGSAWDNAEQCMAVHESTGQ